MNKMKNIFLRSFYSLLLVCGILFPSAAYCADYTIKITPVDASMPEGSPLHFKIELDGATPWDSGDTSLTVNYTVGGGTATSGTDYPAASGSVVLDAGSPSVDISIPTSSDNLVEDDETINVSLSGSSYGAGSAGGTVTLGSDEIGTITNDDTFKVSIEAQPTPASIAENASGTQVVKVTLDNPVDWPVTVNFSYAGAAIQGTDYSTTPSGTSIVIPALSTEGTITLDPTDDTMDEGDEAYTITLDNISPVTSGSIDGANTASGMITADTFIVSIDAPSPASINENAAGTSTVKVKLNTAVDYDVTVNYSYTGTATIDTDYTTNPVGTTFVIPALSTEGSITIDPTDDVVLEQNETYIITVDSFSPSTSGSSIHSVNYIATGTIVSDDQYTVSIEPQPTPDSVSENGVNQVVKVKLDRPVPWPVTVNFAYSGTAGKWSDFTPSPTSNSIAIPTGTTEVTITIDPKYDSNIESAENYTITLTSTSPTIAAIINPTQKTSTGTITDDTFQVSIETLPTPDTIAETDTGTQSVKIKLNRAVAWDVTVNYTYAGFAIKNTDFTTSPSGNSLVIPAGALESTPIVIDPLDDAIVENSENYTITLNTISPTTSGAIVPAPNRITTGTITSEDSYTVTLDQPVPLTEYENGPNQEIKLHFSNPVAWPVIINYTYTGDAVNGSDYNFISATVPALQTESSIFIDPIDDQIVEPDESYTITLDLLAPNTLGSIGADKNSTGTILNEDHNITVTSSGTEGTISSSDFLGIAVPPAPNGAKLVVQRDSTPTFSASTVANTCYHIKDVKVDDISVGVISADPEKNNHTLYTYTFPAVQKDHTIHADYEINTYTITTTELNPDNGTLTDSSEVDCDSSSHVVKAVAKDGYTITWFKVNGVEQPAAYHATEFEYTFDHVTADQAVEVAYSNKIILTHKSPHGTVTSHPSDVEGVIDVDYGTSFVPFDIKGNEHTLQGPGAVPKTAIKDGTDCKDELGNILIQPIFDVNGVLTNAASVQVDQYCNYLDASGKPIYQTPDDPRIHTHHLSSVKDNGNTAIAKCKPATGTLPPIIDPYDSSDPYYSAFTETDYSESAECLYSLNNITQDHEIEVLFTSFVDLRTVGSGSIAKDATILVNGDDGVTDSGILEVQAKDTVTFSFKPIADWYIGDVKLKKEEVDGDRRINGISDIPATYSIGKMLSYTFTELLDQDWGLQTLFQVNELTLKATSTFEKVLFNDADLADAHLITKKDNNGEKIVPIHSNGSFYVVIDDPDFAVVGLSIDNNFLTIKQIKEYAATPASNPDNDIFEFILTSVAEKDRLEVKFKNVLVSHHLEVRDFDGVIISDIPLDAQVNPNPPALMFVLDDSGSMDWEFMVSKNDPSGKGTNQGTYYSSPNEFYYVYDFPFTRLYSNAELGTSAKRNEWQSQFSKINKMFYKPDVSYTPWPSYDGELELPDGPDTGTDPDLVPSKLPSVGPFQDSRAHADMYRPRYYPWHNTDCTTALDKSVQKRAGNDVSGISLATCDNQQTFDLDGVYLPLTALTPVLKDENDATRTGTWASTTTGTAAANQCYNDDFRTATSANSATATATWSITPTVTGDHTVEVSWAHDATRSTAVKYTIACPTCSPAVTWPAVYINQRNPGYYDNGMTLLGTFPFQSGKPVTITVGPSAGGSQSIDALKITPMVNSLTSIINAHYFTWNDIDSDKQYDTNEDIWLVNLTDPITYTRVIDKTQGVSTANLDAPLLGASVPSTVLTNALPTDPQAFIKERQNFADWFSYYRNRAFSATAGMSLAIEKMSDVRVGIKSINYSATYGISQSALPVKVWGERDKTKYLYYLLYNFKTQAYGTPLRSGFASVGRYFDGNDGNNGDVKDANGNVIKLGVVDTVQQSGITTSGADDLSPFVIVDGKEKNGDRCKKAFSILITDGYWNSDNAVGSEVFTDAPSHLKKIYANTLAQTAYDYYTHQDLMGDAKGDLQSMITYGVAFGVKGELPYSSNCTFTNDEDCPTWNLPAPDSPKAIDDLWHASVNGGGEFLSADSPDELVAALESIVKSIKGLVGSSASLAANGDELYVTTDENIRMYQASWSSQGGWFGDLKSYSVDKKTGIVATTANWSAATTLKNRLAGDVSGKRIIATFNPDTESGVPFTYDQLSPDQQVSLYPYFAPTRSGADVVDYLRGDKVAGTTFCTDAGCFPEFLRKRSIGGTVSAVSSFVSTRLLGDIINSKATFQDYFAADGKTSIGGILFVGANDGMLHAFSAKDADMGKELFAYVPNLVFRNLRTLARPDFDTSSHLMFVDNTPITKTIDYGSGASKTTKTLLVGGLGKGGKGYYCLDITDAKSITSETALADRVLWEFPKPPEKIVSSATVNFTVDTIEFDTALTEAQKNKILASKYITVFISAYGPGAQSTTNDGTYEVESISADRKVVTITKSAFAVMSGVTISVTESISDHDVGYSFSRPTFVKTNDKNVGADGWVIIFGNGYGSDNGNASLYILDPLTGEQIDDGAGNLIGNIPTKAGPFNGLSTPKIIDINNDLKADYAYAGDLLGNMWKFDLYLDQKEYDPDPTDADPGRRVASNWQVAFCENGDDTDHCQRNITGMIPKPLFSSLSKQAITSAPDVMRHETGLGYMVIFGTGKFLGWIDLVSTDLQSLYGIWDWAPDFYDQGYLGSRADNTVGGVKHIELTNWPQKDLLGTPVHSLLQQTLLYEGNISEDTDGDHKLDKIAEDTNRNGVLDGGEDLDGDGFLDVNEDVDGDNVLDVYSYYRIPTFHPGDWTLSTNDKLTTLGYSALSYTGAKIFKVPLANLGWMFDLPGKLEVDGSRSEGERMINDTIIRDGKAIMVSFVLSSDKCAASAYSFINERNADTGGMVFHPIFDMTEDGVVDDKDSIMIIDPDNPDTGMVGNPTDKGGEGRLSNPVIGVRTDENGNPIEDKYLSGSAIDGSGNSGAKVEHVREVAERRGVYYWKQVE